jgi:uncharacterized Zn finger protein
MLRSFVIRHGKHGSIRVARRRFGHDADWHDRFPPPSRPIEVAGGIRAQTKRGRFAESWWAERWIAVLESFDIGARLTRGRAYARRGQVLSIDVDKGIARARVQGSRPKPYEVTVKIRPLQASEWTRVTAQLASEAGFAARLLTGEMPHDIEAAFQRAGSSLFPEKSRELATACSCPDWSNPCKHVAAVYYLLGEEFDRDPFLLFQLRGLTRDELLAQLTGAALSPRRTAHREERPKPSTQAGSRKRETTPEAPRPRGVKNARKIDEPPRDTDNRHVLDASKFWKEAVAPDDLTSRATAPPVHAEPVRRLGRFPFWRGATPLLEAVEPVYVRASRRALDLLT